MFATMKGKNKHKDSGSVKIDPQVHKNVVEYCKSEGLVVSVFVTKAAAEKLEKEKQKDGQ